MNFKIFKSFEFLAVVAPALIGWWLKGMDGIWAIIIISAYVVVNLMGWAARSIGGGGVSDPTGSIGGGGVSDPTTKKKKRK